MHTGFTRALRQDTDWHLYGSDRGKRWNSSSSGWLYPKLLWYIL